MKSFQTPDNPWCSNDHATVFDSNGTVIHKFCGKSRKNIEVSLIGSKINIILI